MDPEPKALAPAKNETCLLARSDDLVARVLRCSRRKHEHRQSRDRCANRKYTHEHLHFPGAWPLCALGGRSAMMQSTERELYEPAPTNAINESR